MEEGIDFRLLSRIVQRLHMPSLLYWGLGTSVYLHSSSSTPTDLWSQSHYYIWAACMPIKMLYSCLLVYADLALTDLYSSDRFLVHMPKDLSGCYTKTCPTWWKEKDYSPRAMIQWLLHGRACHVCLNPLSAQVLKIRHSSVRNRSSSFFTNATPMR